MINEFSNRGEKSATIRTRDHFLLRMVPDVFSEAILIGQLLLALAPHTFARRLTAPFATTRLGHFEVFSAHLGQMLRTYVAIKELRIVRVVHAVRPRTRQLVGQLGYDVARLLVQITFHHVYLATATAAYSLARLLK